MHFYTHLIIHGEGETHLLSPHYLPWTRLGINNIFFYFTLQIILYLVDSLISILQIKKTKIGENLSHLPYSHS